MKTASKTATRDDPSEAIFEMLDSDFEKHAGDAARQHLAEGRPIYYRELDTPGDYSIREWPDGSRELVDVNLKTGAITVVRKL